MTTPTEEQLPQSDATAQVETTTQTEATKLTNVKEVLAYLATQFPTCFSLTGEARPLKIGIFQDLAQRLNDDHTVSKTQLRQALRVYTSSWRYLEATKVGVARVDLDGTAGDLIDEQQAAHADKVLHESKAKAAEKRKSKQQEARAKATPKTDGEKPAYKKRPNKKVPAASNKTKVDAKAVQTGSTESVTESGNRLQPISKEQVAVGSNVLIKLGKSPMSATVLEVHKDDVTVQLASGMVVKTRQDSLFSA